jgi:hypothetical protein
MSTQANPSGSAPVTNEVVMSNVENSFKSEIAELKLLFGNPVLSTENPEIYDRILLMLLTTFRPSDFIERSWLKQYADAVWDEIRFRRHKALFFTRKFHQRLKYQARRRLQLDRQKAKITDKLAAQLERAVEFEDGVDRQLGDVDAILARVPNEHDHARVLELGMDYFEMLDQWLERALKRQKEALEWFDRYRNGLGQRLRKVAAQIIELECTVISSEAAEVEGAKISSEPTEVSSSVVPCDPLQDAQPTGPAEPTSSDPSPQGPASAQ